jgi:P27 family predicted phage terminase small subunit
MVARKVPLERMLVRSPGGTTPGHRKLPPTSEMVLERPDFERDWSKIPELPDYIGAEGRKAWLEIWGSCYWLWALDAEWVLQIAECKDKLARWRRIVKAEGYMIDGGRYGARQAHPGLIEESRLQKQITDCMSKLGLSPTERSGLQLNEVKTANGLERLQDRQRRRLHLGGTDE